jgi:hydrogenase expression/formation protein HypC
VVELVEGDAAIVDLGGIRKGISLALVENVAVGDYVILHVGFALTKLDPAEAERTLALFAEAGAIDAGTRPASPFKGEDGRGMGLPAGTGDPSPPLPPPLEGEGSDSGALPGQRA